MQPITPFKERRRLLIKRNDQLISISKENIAYFYSHNRIIFVKTFNNKTHIVEETLDQLQQSLDQHDFFRVNRSYIISYKSIAEVSYYFNRRLKVKLCIDSQEPVIVAKERVLEFKRWLGGE